MNYLKCSEFIYFLVLNRCPQWRLIFKTAQKYKFADTLHWGTHLSLTIKERFIHSRKWVYQMWFYTSLKAWLHCCYLLVTSSCSIENYSKTNQANNVSWYSGIVHLPFKIKLFFHSYFSKQWLRYGIRVLMELANNQNYQNIWRFKM